MIKLYLYIFVAYVPQGLPVIISTVISLGLLHEKQYIFASLVYAAPFIATLIVQPLFARYVYPSISISKIKLIYFTRVAIVINVTLLLWSIGVDSAYMALFYCVFVCICSMEQVSLSILPLYNKEHHKISYARSSSLANLSGRSMMAVAPMIGALYAGGHASALLLPLFIALSGLALPLVMSDQELSTKEERSKGKHLYQEKMRSWALWFISYNFLINLSQGALAFIVLSDAPYGANYLSLLYGAFFAVQVLITFKIVDVERYKPTPLSSCFINILIFLFVFILGVDSRDEYLAYALTLIIGLLYGVSIPLTAQAIIDRLKGPRFVEYLSYAKTSGRLSALASLWIAGTLLESSYRTSTLYIFFGCIGLLFCIALLVYAQLIDKDNQAAEASRPE